MIPALIRKCEEVRLGAANGIVCWGTGQASREFLYVADCAQAIALAADRYRDPVNLGSGQETTIRELVQMIGRLTGFAGEIRWDNTEKPDGQRRRKLDTTRARERSGFAAATPLKQGLRETVASYRVLDPERPDVVR